MKANLSDDRYMSLSLSGPPFSSRFYQCLLVYRPLFDMYKSITL